MSKRIKMPFLFLLSLTILILSGCDGDDPVREEIPEVITKATLTFTPALGTANAPIVDVSATDEDRDGPQDMKVDGSINLRRNVTYTLSIALINELAQPNDQGYNVADEVEEEADEHQFFFSWTGDIFSSPAGNGNISNRAGALNYNDVDAKGNALGLSTTWTTTDAMNSNQQFRIILKHQPEIKSPTSTANDGETDLDITFAISVN
jgi:hypothetical protein